MTLDETRKRKAGVLLYRSNTDGEIEVLLISARKFPGSWVFPGGTLEPGEMPAEAAAARLNRGLDRMERQGIEFHERVRRGFLAEARRFSDRIVVIDASRDVDAIQEDFRAAAARAFGDV